MTGLMLVADIGGTNARFALAEQGAAGAIIISDEQRFRAEDFETLTDAAHAYLESIQRKPEVGCFAVAGPSNADIISFTNSAWSLNTKTMAGDLGLGAFRVVNDFYALAAGVDTLAADDLLSVRTGTADIEAPRLVVGPGTGLGQALIVPTTAGPRVVPTEGGHVSFAPRTDEEYEVLKFISREHPRVSVERLLSGRGLVNIHRALCVIAGKPRITLRADEITRAAIDQDPDTPIAVQAVDMFCELLGRVVGDAVLATGARGGVILGGGILPKIQQVFLASQFEEKFLDKGRMKDYVAPVPVDLIISEGTALKGAAAVISGQTA